MGKFVKAAKIGDVSDGEGKVVDVEGDSVALFNLRGKFFALENTCPHAGGPLGEGLLDTGSKLITCPWHGWEFDATSGECQTSPGVKQRTYPVKVEGNDILIEV